MNQFARPGLAVTELPSFNENDKGKVLKIDSESGVLGWGESGGSGLPSTAAASAGDVLSLDNSKDPVWSAPSAGGGVLVVHDVEGTLDKTWQEIHDAMLSGGAAIQVNETEVDAVLRVYLSKGTYVVISTDGGAYSATSASDYPSYTQ